MTVPRISNTYCVGSNQHSGCLDRERGKGAFSIMLGDHSNPFPFLETSKKGWGAFFIFLIPARPYPNTAGHF